MNEKKAISIVDDIIKNGNNGKGIVMSELERKILIKKVTEELNDQTRS